MEIAYKQNWKSTDWCSKCIVRKNNNFGKRIGLNKKNIVHLFSQNPATDTENSAQSRSEHIFMELTLFDYNINFQYICIKSGLNYLRF